MASKKARFSREQLLKSKRFSGYQRDFLAAVLCQESYTIKEAEDAVKAFFGPKEKESE